MKKITKLKIFLICILALFTSPLYGQRIDPSQIKTTGPRPYYDAVTGYGASGSGTSTTGTISASSSSLALANSINFVNGQGIAIFGAGPSDLAAMQIDLLLTDSINQLVAIIRPELNSVN